MAATPTQTITLVTIDLTDLVNELEWMQDTEPMAFDVVSVVETQAGDGYWNCDDEEHETTLRLSDDHAVMLRLVMAEIGIEEVQR